MASITKREVARGVVFDVRYRDPNGRSRRRTYPRAADARAFAKTIEADVVRGEYLQPDLARSKFDRWSAAWLRTTADLRPKTQVGYESMLRVNVLPHFTGRAVGRIEPVHVRQFLAELTAAGAGPGTVRSARKVLRLILAAAGEGGALRANPCNGMRLARSEPVEMAFLTMDEVVAPCPPPCAVPSTACWCASPPSPACGPARSARCGSAGWTFSAGGSKWPSPRRR